MNEQQVEQQIRIYLFDLMNTAREHGFKTDDNWEINLVADAEKADIQRQYYPYIATRMFPETVLPIFHEIKSRLNQPLSKIQEALDVNTVLKDDLRYLVAYNVKRPRT
ncbi:hypothetical protein GCM10027037_18340 [Mucilaginibacter koreensis]